MAPTLLCRILLVALPLALPVAAQAPKPKFSQARVVSATNADHLMGLMQGEGWSVKIDADGDVEWMLEGSKCWVMVRGDGTTFGFRGMFKSTVTSSKINWWNSNKRWGRCYSTDDGLVVLSQDVEITGGVTEVNLVECMKTWISLFKSWKENVVE